MSGAGTVPRLSVIIPAYNTGPYLLQTLESVWTQRVTGLEICVIDDGSQDETPEILSSVQHQVKSYRIENSGGPARPRNVGLANSSAEIVAFFDSDDIMLPGKLAGALEILEREPTIGLVCSDFASIDHCGQRLAARYLAEYTSFRESLLPMPTEGAFKLPASWAYHHLLRANFIGTSSVVCRRDALTAAGPFDESMRNADDIDMWMRIAATGWDFAYIDRPLHEYRLRSDGVSGRGIGRFPDMIKGLEKQLAQVKARSDRQCVERRLAALYGAYGYALRRSRRFAEAKHAYRQSLSYGRGWAAFKGLGLALFRR
jgi:glycosyltransferase involved in cell wall biosynthesis